MTMSRALSIVPSFAVALAACDPPGSRGSAVSGVAPATASAQVEPARLVVTADDGFQLTMWRKVPSHPRRAVLLVHGRTWSGRPDFDLQVPGESRSFMDALVAHGYAAYALDLRGYGGTPRDPTGFLTPDRAAADVAAALRTIGDRPVLFGWSLGSAVAQLTAQRTPALMSAVILFGSAFNPKAHPIPEHPDPETPARALTTAEQAVEDFRAPGAISRRAIDAYVKAALAADPVRNDWRHDTEWNALAPESVHVPTLVIQAELDPDARTEDYAWMFTHLGTADRQWVVIPGGDHAALLENTAPRMITAICAFIERS
jgi:pimeloyl-ACP methyl ester carboxylesterase